jgi:molybdopterin converting factor subunit 1
MYQVKVLFFASLRDRAGTRQTTIELPEHAVVSDLKSNLRTSFPELSEALGSTLVSINHEFAFDEDPVPEGAEVALFPPVSGGSDQAAGPKSRPELESMDTKPTIFTITEDEIDLNALLAQITLPSTGAACFFTGMVRGITTRGGRHETAYLEYEAYKPMAEGKMRQVADEIRKQWPAVEGIAIIQRIGRLDPMTPTVLIACTAAHRDTGVFEASRYGIDRLKEIVPVWKKEVGPEGESWVEGAYFPKPGE